ncbi:MAG TPA: beta-propeller fold lactonase family protein [Flavipsychrobacter sp.]|nr:beta-propeller fold lactonase family protein [Flavipsychrobacter sp.]
MRYSLTAIVPLVCFLGSCTHEPAKDETTVLPDHYPAEVGKIILTKCATAGCHNAASYQLSGGGLLMDTWEHMFDGGNTGAAVIPYSVENSALLYFTNAYPDLGALPPDNMKMPLNNPPLTREEYLTLRAWIASGAPDKSGNIPFASRADTRQKIYLSHQGCDYITVIDAEKNVVMRSIPTGTSVTIESAYALKISPDGHAYISFWASQNMLKMDTKTDSLVDVIDVGSPNSCMLQVSPDSRKLLLTNIFSGSLLRINTETKMVDSTYGTNSFSSPHGVTANASFTNYYVTEQYGNTLYKIGRDGAVKKISIDGKPLSTANGSNPYSIALSPDESKYFVTCAGTDEIRVFDTQTDTLMSVIPVGTTPQDLAFSRKKPYLFVSCENDAATTSLYKGSVYIIDYNTLQVVRKINDRYYMPHALVVDDVYKKLFVFSRNVDPDGPVPHHNSSTCTGRNGYYSVYDFEKLQPINGKRYEVTIDPFAADARIK